MNQSSSPKLAQSPQQIARERQRKPPTVLAYASRGMATARRKLRPARKWPVTAGIICGTVPMVCATIGFVAWLLLRTNLLAGFTGIMLLVGIALVPVGAGFLVAQYLGAGKQTSNAGTRRQLHRKFWLARLLLIANVPVAVIYFAIAFYLNDVYLVTIRNDSRTAMEQMTLHIGNRDVPIPMLAPGAAMGFESHMRSYSSISYDANVGGKSTHGEFEDTFLGFEGMSDPIIVIRDDDITIESVPWGTRIEHF